MTGDFIRVVLADDHNVVRAGLKMLLDAAPDIRVVGEARTGLEAVALVERLRPDVIVMDLSMPQLDGTAATKAIVDAGLPTRVLVLTMHQEEEYLVPVMEAGASGYVHKSDVDRVLVDAVRRVSDGDVYIRVHGGRVFARNVPPQAPTPSESEKYATLTVREQAVLRLVGQGYSAPEIGERLLISPKTVDTYKQRIQEKMNFSHRSQYVQFALKFGLLTQS